MAQEDSYSWHPIMRSILSHWVWKERPFSKGQAWVDMILLAHHNPCKRLISGVLVDLVEGQLAWPKSELSVRWGWSRDKVERFLKTLQDDDMISQQTSQLTTIITLLNYKDLRQAAFNKQGNKQGSAQGSGQDSAQGKGKAADESQYKKDKKGKKEEGDQKPAGFAHEWLGLPDFLESWNGWIEMRVSKKDRPTDFAKTLAMKKLLKLSGNNITQAIEIVNQSTERGWKGLFELKESANGTHQQNHQQYETAQQRKDRRLREVMASYPSAGRSASDADHPALRFSAEGASLG